MTIKELLPILDYDVDEVTFTIRDYNLPEQCDELYTTHLETKDKILCECVNLIQEQIEKIIDLNVETLFVHPITTNHLSIMVFVYCNKKENK